MSFLFKNYSIVKVTDAIRLGSSCKTNNTDRNGINNQNTHTHLTLRERKHLKGLVSTKIEDTSPVFKTTPPISLAPPFLWENLTPPPLLQKFQKLNSPLSHPYIRGCSNYALAFSI